MLFLGLFRYLSCVLKDDCISLGFSFFLKASCLDPTVCVRVCLVWFRSIFKMFGVYCDSCKDKTDNVWFGLIVV